MNTFVVVGRVARDPESRQLDSGMVCNFTVAESEKVRGKEITNWWRCNAFGKTAEIIMQYVKKGQQVVIDGRMRQREFDKDGYKHTATEVLVNNIQMVGGKQTGTREEPSRYDIKEERRQDSKYSHEEIPF